MTRRVKAALWTGSIAICVYVLRRTLTRPLSIDVGSVSNEWLAQQRGGADELTL